MVLPIVGICWWGKDSALSMSEEGTPLRRPAAASWPQREETTDQRGTHSTRVRRGPWGAGLAFPPKARPPGQHRTPEPPHLPGVWVRGSIPRMPESQAGGKGMQEQSGKTVQNINNTQLIPTASILRERETETALASYPGWPLSN